MRIFVMLASMTAASLVAFASEPTILRSAGSESPHRPSRLAASHPASHPTSQPATAPAEAAVSPADDPTRIVPWLDYRGDIWSRPAMTGDWWGTRQELMDKGIRFDASLVQVMQGSWGGGRNQKSEYQGNAYYDVQIDTGKAGLWPGGMFYVRGETRYGDSENKNVGSLLPVDTMSLYPQPGEPITALTDFYYVQFVLPELGFVIGKQAMSLDNVFASDETSQFMNIAFTFDPVLGMTVPLDTLETGAIFIPTDWFKLTSLVLSTDTVAETSGFDNAFQKPVSVLQLAEFAIKPFDLPGHQRVGWSWSNKDYVSFQQNTRGLILDSIRHILAGGPPPQLDRTSQDWCVFYDFDQYFYNVPGHKDRGLGLFGGAGFSDGHVNPIGQFYDIGVGGKGMIAGRENDQFGVGYYYLHLSDTLMSRPIVQVLNRLGRGLRDEQGIELYYNIAVTNWLHITPDLQIIKPALQSVDTAVVAGIRAKMDF